MTGLLARLAARAAGRDPGGLPVLRPSVPARFAPVAGLAAEELLETTGTVVEAGTEDAGPPHAPPPRPETAAGAAPAPVEHETRIEQVAQPRAEARAPVAPDALRTDPASTSPVHAPAKAPVDVPDKPTDRPDDPVTASHAPIPLATPSGNALAPVQSMPRDILHPPGPPPPQIEREETRIETHHDTRTMLHETRIEPRETTVDSPTVTPLDRLEPPPPVPSLSIGRIDVVFESPPPAAAPPRRQGPERTRGFARYEDARLGRRR